MYIPSLCHASFWQHGNEIHNQEEEAMLKGGSYMPSHFIWRADFPCCCGFAIFWKPNTSNGRYSITFDFCLSMFHVDCNEETSTKSCGLVYKLGAWLLWHCLQCSNSYCSGLDLIWQRLKIWLLQALMIDTFVRN